MQWPFGSRASSRNNWPAALGGFLGAAALLAVFASSSALSATAPAPTEQTFEYEIPLVPAAERPAPAPAPATSTPALAIPKPPSVVNIPAPRTPPAAARAPDGTLAPQPAARPAEAPRPAGNLAAQAMERRIGAEQFQNYMNHLNEVRAQATTNNTAGLGAPMADRFFDGAAPRESSNVVDVRPAGNSYFIGAASPDSGSTPVPVQGSYRDPTPQDAEATTSTYQSIPGGVVLEGVAGFSGITAVKYDARFNALILNDSAVYFLTIPPRMAAIMAGALAKDDKVGVSLGATHIVYGEVPPASQLALDMKITDSFLGDIVFAQDGWTQGYKLAGGYVPQRNQLRMPGSVAVFFKFNGFEFKLTENELGVANARFDVQLYPLLRVAAENGGLQPDLETLAQGIMSPQYQANAKHVADNIGYYRRELIVERMFQYGATAAVLRGLKAQGFDLKALADRISAPAT